MSNRNNIKFDMYLDTLHFLPCFSTSRAQKKDRESSGFESNALERVRIIIFFFLPIYGFKDMAFVRAINVDPTQSFNSYLYKLSWRAGCSQRDCFCNGCNRKAADCLPGEGSRLMVEWRQRIQYIAKGGFGMGWKKVIGRLYEWA